MIVVADTHALIWWLTDPDRLGSSALTDMNAAHEDSDGGILVSVASRLDLHYLVKKGTFTSGQADEVWNVTANPDVNARAVPVTSSVANRFGTPAIMASQLRDPWDRLIVATAAELGVPLVTKDEKIQDLAPQIGVTAIW
jgi:PIN domain nuclease of toxin-antitoxin system